MTTKAITPTTIPAIAPPLRCEPPDDPDELDDEDPLSLPSTGGASPGDSW